MIERGGHVDEDLRAREAPPAPRNDTHFTALYHRHWRFVVTALRYLGVPASTAEDAAQEVFLVLLSRLSELDPSTLRGWLRSVAVRVSSNQRRTLRRRAKWLGAHGVEPDTLADAAAQTPECSLERRELGLRLTKVMERLSREKREVLLLALLEQHTASEIARTMQIPLNTVSSRLRAARLECSRALGKRSRAD